LDFRNALKVPSSTKIESRSCKSYVVGKDAINWMCIGVKRILVFTPLLVFFFKPINQEPISQYNSGDGYPNWQCFVTMHDKNFPIVRVAY